MHDHRDDVFAVPMARLQVEELGIGIPLFKEPEPHTLAGNCTRKGRKAEAHQLELFVQCLLILHQHMTFLGFVELSNKLMCHEQLRAHAAYVLHAPALQRSGCLPQLEV
jgi:hypothetical protein